MMRDYSFNKEEADKLGEQALAKIVEYSLAKTPYNYELWYCYVSKKMPDLNHVVDQMLNKGKTITDVQCRDLYEQYIDHSDRDHRVLEQTSDRIQQSIQAVQGLLTEAQTSAVEYGGSLQNVSSQLSKADSIEAITNVVSTIVNETKSMVKHNKQLEARLDASSHQVDELKTALENVQREALTDALTGLANRKCFDQEIDAELNIAAADNEKLCLLLVDIDHFKAFNDNFGHQVGDQVLKLVANTLINGIKGRDLAARFGGEEFAILLPETPLTAAVKVANNLRERIANKEIINRANNEHMGQITISCGAAEYQPGESIDGFIKRADEALYKAKNNGRNRVESAHNPYINVHKDMS